MELKEIAESMESKEMELLSNTIDELADALETKVKVKNARLPESVFRDFFVPSLARGGEGTEVATMKYVEYAGGPYSEVDIIDDTGTIIFTCPPLYNRSAVSAGDDKIAYTEIAGTYELKKSRMAAEANNYMDGIASGLAQQIKIEKDDSSFKWNNIFDRYAVKDTDDTNMINGPIKKETIADSSLDEMIDYD